METTVEGAILTCRHLNRALLARQHLLARTDRPVGEMIAHLVGMQSQGPTDPYLALWSRIVAFDPSMLSGMLLDRTAIRASLMRGTIHLVTADDYLALQPLMQVLHERVFPSTDYGKRVDPAHVPQVVSAGRELLMSSPMTLKAVGAQLAERWPDRDRNCMAYAIRYLVPLVQTTPRGVWGETQQATWALAEDWLGRPVPSSGDSEVMVRRYLRAFGPATVADIQTWSGLTGLRRVIEGMRSEIHIFRNERGQELFDMPGAQLPDPETPTPVRFLPEFDNVLLSHKDRSRVISDERRRAIGTNNGSFMSTYLVDGFVAGTWRLERSRDRFSLAIRPFEPHAPDTTRDLEEEGHRMLAFLTGREEGDVRVLNDARVDLP